MEFIGSYLKSIRVKQKTSIVDISKELNISVNLIKNIEDDFFPDHISTVFLIGHISAYAKFLNIDEEQIVENFKIQISYNQLYQDKEISKPINTSSLFSIPKTFAFCSTVFIAFSFYFLFVKPNDWNPDFVMTPDVPENLEYNLEETETNIVLEKIYEEKKINSPLDMQYDTFALQDETTKLLSSSKIKIKPSVPSKFSSSSVVASSQNDNNLKKISEKITLKFLNPTWIQLRDKNDNIILSKLMNQGDEYTYNLSQNLNLTAGNAGNIMISFNGVIKGKAGKAGEVIDSLIIDQKFNN